MKPVDIGGDFEAELADVDERLVLVEDEDLRDGE